MIHATNLWTAGQGGYHTYRSGGDVYVEPAYLGRGVGTALLDAVTQRLGELGVGRAMLATQDAHALYARYGFEPLAHPERWMGRTYGPATGPQATG